MLLEILFTLPWLVGGTILYFNSQKCAKVENTPIVFSDTVQLILELMCSDDGWEDVAGSFPKHPKTGVYLSILTYVFEIRIRDKQSFRTVEVTEAEKNAIRKEHKALQARRANCDQAETARVLAQRILATQNGAPLLGGPGSSINDSQYADSNFNRFNSSRCIRLYAGGPAHYDTGATYFGKPLPSKPGKI